MAKVLIYRHRKTTNHHRQPGAEGAEVTCATGWDEFAGYLTPESRFDLIILDSIPKNLRPALTKRIRMIKEVPVIYFEDSRSPLKERLKRPAGEPPDPRAGKAAARESKDRGKTAPASLEAARQFMDGNFRRSMTLAGIAQKSGRSVSYFCRSFKEQYGVSPITYLKNLRLAHAAHLLRHTSLALPAVANQSGFFSIPYFCREFKKANGRPPIQYRQDQARSAKAAGKIVDSR